MTVSDGVEKKRTVWIGMLEGTKARNVASMIWIYIVLENLERGR